MRKLSPNLTKKRFERLLKKAAQPKKESAPKVTETSVAHPSDGCSGTHRSQDSLEGKED